MNKKRIENWKNSVCRREAVFDIFCRNFEATEEMTNDEILWHFENILSRYGNTEYYDFDRYKEEYEDDTNLELGEYEVEGNAEMPKV